MAEEKFRTYDELNDVEKEVLDNFSELKLKADYSQFLLFKYKIEVLIDYYKQLIELRNSIQTKYFALHEEMFNEGLIEGEMDVDVWQTTRNAEDVNWNDELRLLDEINTQLEIAIKKIESGEAKQSIRDAQNNL